MEMKIVTYNVNGLRPRISQHGSLLKLLSSFEADIICFQVPESELVPFANQISFFFFFFPLRFSLLNH